MGHRRSTDRRIKRRDLCVCVCVCVSSDQSRLQVIFFTSTTSALWLNRNGLSAVGTVLFFCRFITPRSVAFGWALICQLIFLGSAYKSWTLPIFFFFLTRIDRIPPTFWTETGAGVPFALIVWCTEFVCLFFTEFYDSVALSYGQWVAGHSVRSAVRPTDRPCSFFCVCVRA